MNKPKHGTEPPLDLESSSQIELDRTFGCDSDSGEVIPHSAEPLQVPRHEHSQTPNRELLQNDFPVEP